MSEETTQATSANGQDTGAPSEPQKTDANDLQNSLNAARRREAEAAKRAAEMEQRLQAFEAKQKEAEEERLKANAEWEKLANDRAQEIESLSVKAQMWEEHEKREAERVEKALEGLTDQQKDLVNALPLIKRMDAINEFKPQQARPGIEAGKGNKSTALTFDEVQKIIAEYGHGHTKSKEAWAAYKRGK